MLNSRAEDILKSIVDKTEYDKPALSRVERLLLELKEAIETGGSGAGGVPFTEEDREKLNSLTNPMLLKDRVNTKEDLYKIPNPKPGWVYLVGYENDMEFAEYIFTDKGNWEFIGYNNIDLSNYVSFDDYAINGGKAGLVAIRNAYGLNMQDDVLKIYPATDDIIKNESSSYRPIPPDKISIMMQNYNITKTTIKEIHNRLTVLENKSNGE